MITLHSDILTLPYTDGGWAGRRFSSSSFAKPFDSGVFVCRMFDLPMYSSTLCVCLPWIRLRLPSFPTTASRPDSQCPISIPILLYLLKTALVPTRPRLYHAISYLGHRQCRPSVIVISDSKDFRHTRRMISIASCNEMLLIRC